MIPLYLPQETNARPRVFTALTVVLGLLAFALIFEKTRLIFQNLKPTAFSERDKLASVQIGKAKLNIPYHFIRSPYQRLWISGQKQRFGTLTLGFQWPYLTPLEEDISSPSGNKFLMELTETKDRESLRSRLEPFYKRLASGREKVGPAGLRLLTLSSTNDSVLHLVAYDPQRKDGFITRCYQANKTHRPICHRSVQVGPNLTVRYTFDQDILPHWQQLEKAVYQKVRSFYY